MATSISNTLSRLVTPFGGAPAKKAPGIDWSAYKPVTSIQTPTQSKSTLASPIQQQAQTPAPTQSSPVNGLIKPDASSLDNIKQTLLGLQSTVSGMQQQQSQPFAAQNKAIFPNIVSSLAQRSTQPSNEFTEGIKKYGELSHQIADVGKKGAAAQAGYLTTGTTPVAEGNAAVVARTQAAQQQALGTQQQAALTSAGLGQTQQTLEQNALNQAGGLAQPQLGNFGQTFYNPTQAGQGGQGGGGTLNPLNNVQSLVQAVLAGQMSPSQAAAQGGNVPNFQGILTQAILAQNPNFNFNQAEVNAQTQGVIGPQGQLASQELQNLQNVISQVPQWQATTVPAINALGNLFSGLTGVGLQSRQELTNAINAVRGSVSTALGTAYSTTPSAFDGMVREWFPDNPTPSQVEAGVQQFNTLMAARASAFGTPGTTSLPGAATGGGSGSANAGGYNFKLVNGRWVPA